MKGYNVRRFIADPLSRLRGETVYCRFLHSLRARPRRRLPTDCRAHTFDLTVTVQLSLPGPPPRRRVPGAMAPARLLCSPGIPDVELVGGKRIVCLVCGVSGRAVCLSSGPRGPMTIVTTRPPKRRPKPAQAAAIKVAGTNQLASWYA